MDEESFIVLLASNTRNHGGDKGHTESQKFLPRIQMASDVFSLLEMWDSNKSRSPPGLWDSITEKVDCAAALFISSH